MLWLYYFYLSRNTKLWTEGIQIRANLYAPPPPKKYGGGIQVFKKTAHFSAMHYYCKIQQTFNI